MNISKSLHFQKTSSRVRKKIGTQCFLSLSKCRVEIILAKLCDVNHLLGPDLKLLWTHGQPTHQLRLKMRECVALIYCHLLSFVDQLHVTFVLN